MSVLFEQKQQHVAIGPGNAHFISVHQVSSEKIRCGAARAARRCCCYSSAPAAAAAAAAVCAAAADAAVYSRSAN